MRRTLFVLSIPVVFFCGVSPLYAQTLPSGAFIVSPVKQELSINPGETKVVTVTLSNGTQYPLTITPSYEDIEAGAQESATDEPIKLLGTQSSKNSLTGIITLPIKPFDLLSGKKIEVPVTIQVGKDIIPGGKYGSVVWAFKIAGVSGTSFPANVAVESRIASLFFVRVLGETRESGALVAFELFNNANTTPPPDSKNPLRFQVAFENTGNVHLNPYGRITVSGMLSNEKVLIIDPWVVLPNATRMREIDLFDGLLPGLYHAHLELNRGYDDVVDERDVTFWVMPTMLQWVIVVIVLTLLGLLIRRSLKISRHFVS